MSEGTQRAAPSDMERLATLLSLGAFAPALLNFRLAHHSRYCQYRANQSPHWRAGVDRRVGPRTQAGGRVICFPGDERCKGGLGLGHRAKLRVCAHNGTDKLNYRILGTMQDSAWKSGKKASERSRRLRPGILAARGKSVLGLAMLQHHAKGW